MRKTIFLPLAAVIALAGCGGGNDADADGDGKISDKEAAAEAKGAVAPRPGQYETKVQVLELDMPQVEGIDSAQLEQMMQARMSTTTSHCVTAEDAQSAAKQMARTPDGGDCSYSKFDVAGGNIDAELSCKGPDGSTTAMKLTGQMGREQSSLQMELEQAAPGGPGGGTSRFKMQMDSKRIGDCT